MKDLIASQDWIPALKKNSAAKVAANMLFRSLPPHVRREIETAARESRVEMIDAILANFAYEVALVSLAMPAAPSQGLIGSILSSFCVRKATPIGCTTLVSLRSDSPPEEYPNNTSVVFARNLDWPDRDGALKRNVFIRTVMANNQRGLRRAGLPPTFQTVTFPGYSGVLTGFAPGRFAVAINAVGSDERPVMGAAPTFLLREALDECLSFQDAVKMLSERPLVTSAAFTVANADPLGSPDRDAVVIERTPTKYAHRYPEKVGEGHWLVVATNDMRRISTGPTPVALPGLSETACKRYDGVFRDIPAGLSVEETLRAAEFGCTVYRAKADILRDRGLCVW